MESVKFAAPVDNNNNEWKTKKNYGPAALFTVVLLGTAFLAGKSYGRNSNDPTSSVSPITSLSVPDAAGGLLLLEGESAPTRCPACANGGMPCCSLFRGSNDCYRRPSKLWCCPDSLCK